MRFVLAAVMLAVAGCGGEEPCDRHTYCTPFPDAQNIICRGQAAPADCTRTALPCFGVTDVYCGGPDLVECAYRCP